jgi:outer membrane protein insertion porin family
MKLNIFFGVAAILALAAPVLAQRSRKPESGPVTLAAIHAAGSKRIGEADIVAACGLRKGDQVTVTELEAAAKRLAGSGAFKEVNYSYQGGSGGLRVEFRVTDADRFVPARFDNFAWLPPKQLLEKLHEAVPLFSGELPPQGNLEGHVQQELQGILTELGVAGTVHYQQQKHGDGPLEAVVYTVDGVRIDIQKVSFPGATPALLPALEEAADWLVGTEYSLPAVQSFAAKRLLPVYSSRGYLRASFGEIVPMVVKSSTESATIGIEVPVNEGLQYRIGSITLSGYKAFPLERLRSLVRVAPGQFADQIKINQSVNNIEALYLSSGYVKSQVQAVPEFNDAAALVGLAIRIHEGAAYRMGDLDVVQFDQRATAKVQGEWHLSKGDAFDGTYPQRFMAAVVEAGAPRVKIELNPHDSDKTVDVVVRPAE